MLYFAYGSNLSLKQMARRCPGHQVIGRAVLHDWRLIFPRRADDWDDAGVAGIESVGGEKVEGAVYDLSSAHLEALDQYEGIDGGEYTRTQVQVVLADGAGVTVMAYLATAEPDAPFLPGRRYMQALIEGAADHGLSEAYTAMLRAIAVV